MLKMIDTDGEGLHFEAEEPAQPRLDLWRWSFADLPDTRTKGIVAGWMMRVLLGADPAEMSSEEMEVLSLGARLTLLGRTPAVLALRCEA